MAEFLTKSNFQTGRRCIKRLWHEYHNVWQKEQSANDEKNALEGERFNAAVHQHFSDGIMVGWTEGTVEQAVEKTRQFLNQQQAILFEAAFKKGELVCFADVVIKQGDELILIEAKSSNNPKLSSKDNFEHIYDAAFQYYVMSLCGFKPTQTQILHANAECVWPDKDNLFSFADISEDVIKRQGEIKLDIERFLTQLKLTASPDVFIGTFCKKPADKACPHINKCWTKPTVETIYDLPRMTGVKLQALEAIDVHLIEDIPFEADLTKTQKDKVELIQEKSELVDKARLIELMDKLVYPIHFFDFETYNASVPIWNNSTPWQQVPFQYSLHILEQDGSLTHFEFLSHDITDPRPALIQSMKSHFKEQGSVVVYYESFEKSRIDELARDFPEHQEFLQRIYDRVWDQYEVFKQCFFDYRLALSQSIKVVLPTFVPELSYKSINVQKGDQAQLVWRKMIEMSQGRTKQKLIEDLKAYCELDTLAMVRLHDFLVSLKDK